MKPKVLLFDIETSPVNALTWGLHQVDVAHVVKNSHLLSFAAKWRGEKKTHCYALPDFQQTFKRDISDDRELVLKLHEFISAADIVVAHNAQFDTRKFMARCLANNIQPPKPVRVFCTLKAARKNFFLDSNRLDAVAKLLLGVGKLKHGGMSMWVKCLGHGTHEETLAAFREMKRYNIVDTQILERVFERILPYTSNFPDLNMWTQAGACPTCQSAHVIKKGYLVSKAGKRQQFQCRECGNWHSGKIVKEAA